MLIAVLYPVSLLPLPALYLISDFAFFVLYRILEYRKTVVWNNLKYAFPEKSDEALNSICEKFYRNFCNQWMETLKLLSISETDLNKRVEANWEVFDKLNFSGKDCYALVGHMFNWEWLNAAWQYNIKQQYACFYKPVSNRQVDRLMYRIRSRSNGWLISIQAKKGLQKLHGVRFVLGLAADQNPADIKHALWLRLMHRDAPFFQGAEKLARRTNAAVVFATTTKTGCGRYRIHFELITDNAASMLPGEITRLYVQALERQLYIQPENWLWSHRRWKHTRPKTADVE